MRTTSTRRALLVTVLVAVGLAGCAQPAARPSAARPPEPTADAHAGPVVSVAPRSLAGHRLVAAPATAGKNVYAATTTGRLPPAAAHIRPLVYVPNSESASLDVIDPRTFRVVAHHPIGDQPHHVTPSWDSKRLYVDLTGANQLLELDPRTGRPGRTIPVTDPYNLYFTPDGHSAVVVAERFNRLDFRDPASWRLLGSVPIPYPGADHLDFTADGRQLLVTTEYSGMVLKVDVRAQRVTGQVQVGGLPVDVKLSQDGRAFYVANQGRGGVSIVDPIAMRELAFLPTGKGAHGLYVSRDTRSLYVTNRLAGTISVIDFTRRRIVATWRIGGTPDMGGLSPDGRQFWVTGRYTASVYVVDTRTGRLLRTIRVGRAPHGLAYFPQPGRYCVGHTGVYR